MIPGDSGISGLESPSSQLLGASIHKYSHVFCRIKLHEMLTPFCLSSWAQSSLPKGLWPRAAQVLGCLAEAYTAMNRKGKAEEILHKYYNEKYNRFSAFRREVKGVVTASDLLRNAGFLKWMSRR